MLTRRRFLVSGGAALFSAPTLAAAAPRGKTVLLGATARACGRALAHPGDTMILEAGLHPAPEFLLSLDPETAGAPRTRPARALAAFLRANGALTDGGLLRHLPASYLFSAYLARHGVTILYGATCAGWRTDGDGTVLTVCGGDGAVETFRARRVIDARPRRTRALSAWLVRPGTPPDTRLFRVPLPPDADWPAARRALHDAWDRQRGAFPGFTLAAEAGVLKRDAGFPDFFRAFEDGLAWTGM